MKLLLILVSLIGVANAQERSLTVGGTERSYRLHLPNGERPQQAVPLVVVFHGGGGDAENGARMSGMDAKSDREGFIAVYPNGSGWRFLTWNTWRCCGPALDQNVDDVGFVRALVESLAREYPVDRKRIYATGMSNGGMMAYRVACELADLFAAIAPVAGALNTDDCRPSAPVSVVAFHGTADGHVRFEGGEPRTQFDRHKREDKSVAFAMQFWSRHDGCSTSPRSQSQGHVMHDVYACPRGVAVELYAIEGQGHAWPGGEKGRRFGNVDSPSIEISATNVMWAFFARHPKP